MGKKKDFVSDVMGMTVLGLLLIMSIFFVASSLMSPKLTEIMLLLKYWYVFLGGCAGAGVLVYLINKRERK